MICRTCRIMVSSSLLFLSSNFFVSFLSFSFSFSFLLLSFLGGESGLCCSFRFIFLETIQKILGSVDCFLAISLFLSFTQFLWVRTNCLWSSNNLFFCSTEILGVLVGNKFSSFLVGNVLLKSGMAGGCLGYHCVGGRQNSPGRRNGKTEYIF